MGSKKKSKNKSKNKSKKQKLPNILNKNALLLAGLSGVLSILMFPIRLAGVSFPDFGFLVWIFLVPLILATHGNTPTRLRTIFCLSFFTMTISNYGKLYWLITAMEGFGGMDLIQAFGTLTALVILLAGMFSVFFTIAIWVRKRSHLPYFLLIPIFLTLRDAATNWWPFGGYPYGIPPYSQGEWLSYLQWVDHTGVLGVSFFIYLINGLLADAVYAWFQNKKATRAVIMPATAIVLLFALSWGASELSHSKYETNKKTIKTIKLALPQGNIAQEMKWNRKLAKQILSKYIQLTDRAINDGAEIVIWPETSYPYGILNKKMKTQKFLNRSSFQVPLLVGSTNIHKDQNGKKIYNSVVHVDQSASFKSMYRKMHLVPFGEYLPFRKYLKFMEGLSQGVGFFEAGNEYVLFDILGVKWAPLICIEDIYARYAREFTKMGAHVLMNFTNDAWYGDSPHATPASYV